LYAWGKGQEKQQFNGVAQYKWAAYLETGRIPDKMMFFIRNKGTSHEYGND